jgi:hypothetical protein
MSIEALTCHKRAHGYAPVSDGIAVVVRCCPVTCQTSVIDGDWLSTDSSLEFYNNYLIGNHMAVPIIISLPYDVIISSPM